jgi:hypothetical protein
MMDSPRVRHVTHVGKRPRDSDTPLDRGPIGPRMEELIASEVLTAMAKDQVASDWISQALIPPAFPPESGLQAPKSLQIAAALQHQVLTPRQAYLPQWSHPEIALPGIHSQGHVQSQSPVQLPPSRPALNNLAPSPSPQVPHLLQYLEYLLP